VIPNLEELWLNAKDAAKVCQGQFSADLFHKLRVLGLQCFDGSSADFPFNLEKIWNQDLRVDQLLQNLETLEVMSCGSLINLALSASSFGNLTALHVRGCKALKYLVTSSSCQKSCATPCNEYKGMQTGDRDCSKQWRRSRKLESLKLDCLASLASFCSVNFTFRFPYRRSNCDKLSKDGDFFPQGILSTPKSVESMAIGKKKDKGTMETTTLTSPFNSLHI
ncbi:hypothetical protein OIU85_005251, partial [Salix viminalis]